MTDVVLDVVIDYLSDVRIELQADLPPGNTTPNKTIDQYQFFDYLKQCPRPQYKTRIVHRNPLIIYIENFLSKSEIEHLLEIT